jgi:hypothetical protein
MDGRNIRSILEKNMKLYVNGCSFAYGIGIERYAPGNMKEVYAKCEAKRFSKLLADAWKMEEMNMATPGSSNSRIAPCSIDSSFSTCPEGIDHILG